VATQFLEAAAPAQASMAAVPLDNDIHRIPSVSFVCMLGIQTSPSFGGIIASLLYLYIFSLAAINKLHP
jgi:hypothetical protein